MLKIVVIGDVGTGKTSIIRSFLQNSFDINTKPTIGANFFQKSMIIGGSEISIQFWDTTGSEKVWASFDIYLRGCVGVLLVDNYSNYLNAEGLSKSMDKLQEWRSVISAKTALSDGRPVPIVLCLNKCDSISVQTSEASDRTADESNKLCQ